MYLKLWLWSPVLDSPEKVPEENGSSIQFQCGRNVLVLLEMYNVFLLCWVVESLWLFVLTLLLWFFCTDESAVNMYVLHSGNSLIWIQVIAEARP